MTNISKNTSQVRKLERIKTVRTLIPQSRLSNHSINILIDQARSERARLAWLIRKYKKLLS